MPACGGVGSGVSRRWPAARRDESGAVSPRTAPRPVSASADTQSGCGTPPCLQSDSAVDSSASARRARACPSVEAGQWFVSPGSREPVSSNAEPHHTEPSFAQRLLTPQTEPSRRSRLPSLERRKTAAKRVLWACRPMPRTTLLDVQGLPGQPSTLPARATSAADARAGN